MSGFSSGEEAARVYAAHRKTVNKVRIQALDLMKMTRGGIVAPGVGSG
jgi:hypothetical protein